MQYATSCCVNDSSVIELFIISNVLHQKTMKMRKGRYIHTGKYLSEALIIASTNPQYDNKLFIELWVQYMKITSTEHVLYTFLFVMKFRTR